MFERPFSFEGRIRRTEFGLSYLFYIIAANVVLAIIGSAGIDDYFILLFLIPFLWFIIAQGTKRCHDRGNSGWYQLIPFYFFWMLFANSDFGNNEYGPNPKGEGNIDEIDEIGGHLNA
jgi:uncharacterized membrane protein YhaH (DUF805 family)